MNAYQSYCRSLRGVEIYNRRIGPIVIHGNGMSHRVGDESPLGHAYGRWEFQCRIDWDCRVVHLECYMVQYGIVPPEWFQC